MASANPTTNLTRTAWSWVARIDRVVIPFLRRVAVPMLRVSLGVVFVWFGLLKIFESFENEQEALNSFAPARNQAAG